MTKAIFRNLIVIVGAIVVFVSFHLITSAISKDDIVYPVSELNGCKNETECRAFCGKSENINACVVFAEKHNLMSREEAETARKFAAVGAKGPGDCNSQESCERYCNDIDHMDECLTFAEESGLMPPQELEEAKRVKEALAQGAKLPGGCRSKQSCEVFCEDPNNMEECIAFAEKAGFIPQEELAEAKQALQAIKKGVKAPACRGRQACDAYCSEPNHFEECIIFAEAAGFIKPEEAELARKTGGRGPGGCRGRECETFCDNPENSVVCFNFAKEHGILSPEDEQRFEEGKQKIQEALSSAPPGVQECVGNTLGSETFEKLRAGTGAPSEKIGNTIRTCFEQFFANQGPDGFGPGGPFGGQSGDHPSEGFVPPPGFKDGPGSLPVGGEFRGPGGCTSPEECQAYCQSNPQACQGFGQQRREGPGGSEGAPPDFPPQPLRESFWAPSDGQLPSGFPAGQISPEQLQQLQQQYPEQFHQIQEQLQDPAIQQQIQEQYQQQFQDQYRQQYPSYPPPGDGGQYPLPPPDYQQSPPPPSSSQGPFDLLLGVLLSPLLNIFAR